MNNNNIIATSTTTTGNNSDMNNNNNEMQKVDDPHTALTKCLFSQYGFTFASVSVATAYSVYKRPKNGISIMLLSGATGTIVDLLYGYVSACSKEVIASQQYYHQQKLQELQIQQQQQQQQNLGTNNTATNVNPNDQAER